MSDTKYKPSLIEFNPSELSVVHMLINFWINIMMADVVATVNPALGEKFNKAALAVYDSLTSNLMYEAFSPKDMRNLLAKSQSAVDANLEINPQLAEFVELARKAREAGQSFDIFGPDGKPKI